MVITHKLKMNMEEEVTQRLEMPMGDVCTRSIEMLLYARQSPWTIPEGVTVLVCYQKSDGTKGVYDTMPDGTAAWSVDDNALTVSVAPQVLSAVGIVALYAQLYLEEKVLHTFAVEISVKAPLGKASGAASQDYYYVTNVLRGPVMAQPGQLLAVEDVDAYGRVIKMKSMDTADVVNKGGNAVLYTSQLLTASEKAQARENIGALSIPHKTVLQRVLQDDLNLNDFGTTEIEGVVSPCRDYRIYPKRAFLDALDTFDFTLTLMLNGNRYTLEKADCSVTDKGTDGNRYWVISNPVVAGGLFEIQQFESYTYVVVDGYTPTSWNLKLYSFIEEQVEVPFVATVNGAEPDKCGNVEIPLAEEVTALQSKFVGDGICLNDRKDSDDHYVIGVAKGKVEMAQYDPDTGAYSGAKTFLTNEDEARILDAANADKGILPVVFTDEGKKVISQAQSSSADFRFVAFADPHSADWKKYEKYNDLLASGCIDAIVGLGDYQVYNPGSRGDTIKQYTEMLTHAGRTPNCFYAIGNHDVAYKNANGAVPNQDEILTKKELHDCLSRHLNGVAHFNEVDPYGGYYYVDYEASKIRLIILNTSDIYEPDGSLRYKYTMSVMMQQPQIKWLTETALDFTDKTKPADWSVLVCFHANFEESTEENEQMLSAILSAVKNGTKLERSWEFKRTLDNPNTTGGKNLLPLPEEDSYSAVGATITHCDGWFKVNGDSSGANSFEIVTQGNEYADLAAGVTYTLSLNYRGGSITADETLLGNPLRIYIKTKTAEGTVTPYELNNGTSISFTPAEDCKLIRFAISVPLGGIKYKNFICEPSLTAAGDTSGANEEERITTLFVNKDFSQQGKVNVIGAFYGHDHKNNALTANGIPFVEFISDNNKLDDFYVAGVDGLSAGDYFFTTNKGIKMAFTLSGSLPNAAVVGYNNYFAKGGERAIVRFQDANGNTIGKLVEARKDKYADGMTEITGFVQERTPNTAKTESCFVVSVDKDSRTIKIVPYGTGFCREINY